MSAARGGGAVDTSNSPRRNTAGEDTTNGTTVSERTEDAMGSTSRPRGASSGALGATNNVITTTPKKGGLSLLTGKRNAALKASSDGDSSSNRDGSSEGGASPSDENEARARLLAKIEGSRQRLLQINLERERELDEFIAMADKIEAAGGRDTPHMARIRQHYDRKNKKSTGLIDTVQKKLAQYEARFADLERGGSGAAPDPLHGHPVLQGIRRTGANIRHMTSTVVSAPLELAQKLKRGTMGSSSDPIDGELGQSQFYPTAQASRSASILAPATGATASPSTAASTSGNAKPKASTLPANMRMSPVDLEAAARAAVANNTVPSSSSSATASSLEWPMRSSRRETEKHGVTDPKSSSKDDAANEDSLARLPPLGAVLAERKGREGAIEEWSRGEDAAPFVMVPRTSLTGGSSVTTADEITAMFAELRQLRQHNFTIVEHMDKLQDKVQRELARQEKLLTEERFKFTRVEDTLNEFIELHQAETSTLKHDLQLIASRIDYQYNDRFKKVEENLESTQNHMFRVENSLRSSLEVKEAGPMFNTLMLSGATILVEVLKIVLYLTATVLDFFRPFTGTRTKAGFFLLILFVSVVTLQNIGWIIGLFSGSGSGAAVVNSTDSIVRASINATYSAVAAAVAGADPAPTAQPPP